MSIVKHIKIKDWEVCCNDFMIACVNESINLDYNGFELRISGTSRAISYCPFCGKEIVYPLEKEKSNTS